MRTPSETVQALPAKVLKRIGTFSALGQPLVEATANSQRHRSIVTREACNSRASRVAITQGRQGPRPNGLDRRLRRLALEPSQGRGPTTETPGQSSIRFRPGHQAASPIGQVT